ncbi:hypothetical protein N431DRAFT_213560 [Stipitochalara longipes BDJ]|nr:hypothetical protein N431DRAFT_213560 [Stipitochalara longipes BDJ]
MTLKNRHNYGGMLRRRRILSCLLGFGTRNVSLSFSFMASSCQGMRALSYEASPGQCVPGGSSSKWRASCRGESGEPPGKLRLDTYCMCCAAAHLSAQSHNKSERSPLDSSSLFAGFSAWKCAVRCNGLIT